MSANPLHRETHSAIERLRGALANAGDARDDVLALLVLATAPTDALHPTELDVLARFLARIGAADTSDGPELAQRIGAHFDAHPLPHAIATDITAALRELVASSGVADHSPLLGIAMSVLPVGLGARPAGSTRMGVMGRFALQAPEVSR